jgi:hypothetical protein
MGQQSKQSQPPAPQYGGGAQAQNLGQGWGGGYHYFTPQGGYQGLMNGQNYGPQLGYGAPQKQSWGYQGPSTLGFTQNWQPGGANYGGGQPPQQPGMTQLPGPLYGQAAPSAPQMPSTPSYGGQLQQAAQQSYAQSGSKMPFDQYVKEYAAQRGTYTPYQQGQNAYGFEDVLSAREKAIAQSRAAQAAANAGGGATSASGADAWNQAYNQNERAGDAARGGIFSASDLTDMDKVWLYANQYKGGQFGEQGGTNLGMSAPFKTTDEWRKAINDVGNSDLITQIVEKSRTGELDKYDSPFVRKYKVYMGLANPQDYAQQQQAQPAPNSQAFASLNPQQQIAILQNLPQGYMSQYGMGGPGAYGFAGDAANKLWGDKYREVTGQEYGPGGASAAWNNWINSNNGPGAYSYNPTTGQLTGGNGQATYFDPKNLGYTDKYTRAVGGSPQSPSTEIANTGAYGAPPTNPGVPPVAQPAVIPAAQLPWTKGTTPPPANGPEAALGPRPTRQWRGWGSGGPTGLRAFGTMTNAAGGM